MAAAAACVAVAGCGEKAIEGADEPAQEQRSQRADPGPKVERPMNDPPVALPPHSIDIEGCEPAPRALVERVEANLADEATALRLAYTAADEAGRTLLGASVYAQDGYRLSSADTWVVDRGKVYALSGSANEYSDFPDGRDLPGSPSAGGRVPLEVQQDCTIPAISAAAR